MRKKKPLVMKPICLMEEAEIGYIREGYVKLVYSLESPITYWLIVFKNACFVDFPLQGFEVKISRIESGKYVVDTSFLYENIDKDTKSSKVLEPVVVDTFKAEDYYDAQLVDEYVYFTKEIVGKKKRRRPMAFEGAISSALTMADDVMNKGEESVNTDAFNYAIANAEKKLPEWLDGLTLDKLISKQQWIQSEMESLEGEYPDSDNPVEHMNLYDSSVYIFLFDVNAKLDEKGISLLKADLSKILNLEVEYQEYFISQLQQQQDFESLIMLRDLDKDLPGLGSRNTTYKAKNGLFFAFFKEKLSSKMHNVKDVATCVLSVQIYFCHLVKVGFLYVYGHTRSVYILLSKHVIVNNLKNYETMGRKRLLLATPIALMGYGKIGYIEANAIRMVYSLEELEKYWLIILKSACFYDFKDEKSTMNIKVTRKKDESFLVDTSKLAQTGMIITPEPIEGFTELHFDAQRIGIEDYLYFDKTMAVEKKAPSPTYVDAFEAMLDFAQVAHTNGISSVDEGEFEYYLSVTKSKRAAWLSRATLAVLFRHKEYIQGEIDLIDEIYGGADTSQMSKYDQIIYPLLKELDKDMTDRAIQILENTPQAILKLDEPLQEMCISKVLQLEKYEILKALKLLDATLPGLSGGGKNGCVASKAKDVLFFAFLNVILY